MFCYKCGKEITDDASYCLHCGTALKSQQNNTHVQQENESCALGVLSIIFAFLCAPIGMILGAVGRGSLKNPQNQKLCDIGFTISFVCLIVSLLAIIIYWIVAMVSVSHYY